MKVESMDDYIYKNYRSIVKDGGLIELGGKTYRVCHYSIEGLFVVNAKSNEPAPMMFYSRDNLESMKIRVVSNGETKVCLLI